MGNTALHVHITDLTVESRDSKDVDNCNAPFLTYIHNDRVHSFIL